MLDPAIIVITQVPDRALAGDLARILLEQRLAACVNIGAPVESIYHWRGRIETGEEIPVIIKTRASRYAEVEAAIRKLHPYELPEIVAVPVVHGLPEYLDWVSEETAIPIG